jgi:hypothetical protein
MKNIQTYENWFKKNKKPEPREFVESRIDPTQNIFVDDNIVYTDDYTQEDLMLSSYEKEEQENSLFSIYHCPLCKTEGLSITHGQTIHCTTCNMKMTNYGNALTCKIDNKTLNLYNNFKKFNI